MKHQGYAPAVFLQLSMLEENDGFTVKNFEFMSYKSGWQVALRGKSTTSVCEAQEIIQSMGGSCGVWYFNGTYYIDECRRVDTKKDALRIGRDHQQISIYGWARGVLAYC